MWKKVACTCNFSAEHLCACKDSVWRNVQTNSCLSNRAVIVVVVILHPFTSSYSTDFNYFHEFHYMPHSHFSPVLVCIGLYFCLLLLRVERDVKLYLLTHSLTLFVVMTNIKLVDQVQYL